MRVLALHPDVVVVVSRMWQTTATLVRCREEALLIDSPVLPDELDGLASVAAQAGFGVRGLLATHGDWDHLLGPLAFPDAALGAGEPTAARLRDEPGVAQRELRAFDVAHYVARQRPLGLGAVQVLPVPGRLSIGDRELELHPANGHTADGLAVLVAWAHVLVCGDFLSPVEIPTLGRGGSLVAYRETLERLGSLLDRVSHVVPGHGAPLPVDGARSIWEQDLVYLEALEADGAGAPLPADRRSAQQRRLHAENVARLAGSTPPRSGGA